MPDTTGVPQGEATAPLRVLDGRYELGPLIGRGGMGAVYRAFDTRLHRPVAVKMVHGAARADERRFALEVRTLARLSHPNLVRLFDAGETDEGPFLVMELIDGSTLARRVERGPLTPDEVRRIGEGVAGALAYVHRDGVVHRDVKPANILIDGEGRAHLADFGIARLVDTTGITATGTMMGTPAYLAPEQLQGGAAAPPADVYALGLVLLEALHGRRAYEGTASEIAAARLQRDPEVPGGLGASWEAVLSGMTARRPEDRLSAAVAAESLARLEPLAPLTLATTSAGDGTTTATTGAITGRATPPATDRELRDVTERAGAVPPAGPSPGTSRRRRVLVGLVVAALLAATLVGLAGTGALSGTPAVHPHTVASRAAPTTTAPTTTAPTTTAPTTTAPTTTAPTTTTTPPTTTLPATTLAPTPVSADASAITAALQAALSDGSIAAFAGGGLIADADALSGATTVPGPAADASFTKLVRDYEAAYEDNEVTGGASVDDVDRAITTLGNALGYAGGTPSSPPTSIPQAPGRSDGFGHHFGDR